MFIIYTCQPADGFFLLVDRKWVREFPVTHFIDHTRHKCRILSDDVIILITEDDVIILITEDDVIILITEDDVILSITEDDVILSITEDDVINYIHILYLYTRSVYIHYNIVVML